jgi:histidinol-phosphate aminotransferase
MFSKVLSTMQPGPVLAGPVEKQRLRGRPYKARMGANECLFDLSDKVKEAIVNGVQTVSQYGDPTHQLLRADIAQQWDCAPEQVVVGEGVEGLMELFTRAMINAGDTVISTAGTYPTIAYYVRGFGGLMSYVPYQSDFSIDLNGLLDAAIENNASMIYLANPDNPTGLFISKTQMLDFISKVPDNCLLLLDEAYAEFADDELALPCATSAGNLVRLRSFSKAYGLAGARVGYAIGPQVLMSKVDQLRQRFGVSKLSGEMALAAYNDTPHLNDILALTEQGRVHYGQMAQQCGYNVLPSSTNFVTFDCGSAERSQQLANWLDEHDIAIIRPERAPLNRLIRITIGPLPARQYLEQTLQSFNSLKTSTNEG